MATVITEECINCGACEPECPNTAIYAGGAQWELNGTMQDALSNDLYYIVPEKCTECVGHFDQEQCAAVCPVDCCIPDPNHPEAENQLFEKAKKLHPDRTFPELSAATSRFRKG
jgi:ferredoxin